MSARVESDRGPAALSSLNRDCLRDNATAKPATNSIPEVALTATSAATYSHRIPAVALFLLVALVGGLWSYASYLRWANYGYRTFDLAYYVQAVWQLIHGRFALTVEDVPLLGNHVEPIVFLFAPIFAIVRHPILFVVVQNAGLASMAPFGYLLARRRFDRPTSALLALALVRAHHPPTVVALAQLCGRPILQREYGAAARRLLSGLSRARAAQRFRRPDSLVRVPTAGRGRMVFHLHTNHYSDV